jgi:hypothetical protein
LAPAAATAVGAAGGTGKARPSSGNKKFLESYGLNKFNLFAPS